MLAERYATEDMKKDVDDLFTVIKEAGNKRFQAIQFINSAYRTLQMNTQKLNT